MPRLLALRQRIDPDAHSGGSAADSSSAARPRRWANVGELLAVDAGLAAVVDGVARQDGRRPDRRGSARSVSPALAGAGHRRPAGGGRAGRGRAVGAQPAARARHRHLAERRALEPARALSPRDGGRPGAPARPGGPRGRPHPRARRNPAARGRTLSRGGAPARPARTRRAAPDAGSELQWRSGPPDGRRAYRSRLRSFVTIGSSTSYTRGSGGAARVAEAGPGEWGDTDAFDERLRRALKSRAFLALTVSPRRLPDAERVLASAFAVDARSADELLIRHMRAAAREAGADWRTVLRADREPRGGADWATLLRLVGHRALPRVRAELAAAPRAVLLTNLGLLARYDQMTFLDGLRDAAGGPDGPPGVWLLVPSDAQESRPMVDRKPVPVFTAAQWARIPSAWLARWNL